MKKYAAVCVCLFAAIVGFAQQSVTSLTLMNSDTDLPMAGYDPLVEGATLDLATLPTRNMNIRANTSPATVGSVRFGYNGNANQQTETSPPYALMRDTSGDYWDWTPAVGAHTVTATPYSAAGASGTVGTPLTINFTVTDSASGGGGTGGGSGGSTGTGAWLESGGLLVMEAEHGELVSDWVVRPTTFLTDPTMAGSLGEGWLEWSGAQYSGNTKTESQVNAIITYTFKIETEGEYIFRWRGKQYNVGTFDAGNDTFVSFNSGTPVAGYYDFSNFTKVWVQSKPTWSWNTTFEPVHAEQYGSGKARRYYTAGTHSIQLAARSPGHAIDRIVLHKTTVPFNAATFESAPESDREGAAETMTYNATTDFPVINSGAVPYYVDAAHGALAINAGNESYRGKFARAQTTFSGVGSTYDVTITSMKELDGECSYRFLVNGQVVGSAKNDETTTDYELQNHIFSGVSISSNDTIAVESNTDSNGKVQESGQPAGVWAWARGRWTTLTLTPSTGGGGGADADPVASAGSDVALLLPNTQIVLSGSATDDGTVESLVWSQVSGPNAATLSDTNAAALTASGLMQGSYVFRLTATDDAGNTGSDDVVVTVTTANSSGVLITGELRQWHKVTLTIDGPTASESGTPNPFTDYRMNVTFTHPDTGLSYVVPGYFAADGNAGETGATSGNKWRAHLSPDHVGEWNYAVSFRSGSNVATGGPAAGSALAPYDGKSGSFSVAESDKPADDFRRKGRLTYDGTRYLKHASSGTAFIKTGADAPENFLAYNEFDNTYTHGEDRIKSWGPHVGDWQSGDPTWKGGKGKGIIGAINYLASEGQNVFSFLTYNAGGDSKDVWPFTQHTNPLVYDCSKLDQWEIVFQHGQNMGMYLHFKTQETENDNNNQWALDNGDVGPERKLYYRELIARFGHHLALNWNLGEENNQTEAQEKAMAQFFYDTDPYHHNIVLHTFPGEHYRYDWHHGSQSKLTGASIQTAYGNVHKATLEQISKSTAAGRPWVVANDEQGSANLANPPDDGWPGYAGGTTPSQRQMRSNVVWGNLMAGGAGIELYAGYQMPESDLTLQDFRSRDRMWDYCRHAKYFFNNHIPFSEMKNENGLVGNGGNNNTKLCFAKRDKVYAIYLFNGGTTTLNLSDATGPFVVKWFNPRDGGSLLDGSVTTVNGGGSPSIGNPPNNTTQDWAVLVCRSGSEFDGENSNTTPRVDAGSNRTIVLPDNQVTLSGAASDNGSITNLVWSQESGPATAILSGEDTATLTASDLAAGTYVFRLSATDDEGNTESDTVSVLVKVNTAPTITTTALPDATATLAYSHQLQSTEGEAPFTWSLSSGSLPGGMALSAGGVISGTPALQSTNTFTVSVKDKDNESDDQELTLMVGPEPNTATAVFNPTDDAYLENGNPNNNAQLKIEPNKRVAYIKFNIADITDVIESAVLSMKVAGDAGNGTINFYAGSHNNWTETTITSANAPAKGGLVGSMSGAFAIGSVYTVDLKSMLNGTGDGVYTLVAEMAAGGNDAWFSSSEGAFNPSLEVTYEKGVIIGTRPYADAGQDVVITLPDNEATLGGSASDVEGPVTVQWSKTAGPAGATLSGAATATLTVSDLVAGTYTFEMVVTDADSNVRKDSATVTVKPEPLPPVDLGSFNTGTDIFLPQFDSNRDPDDLHSIAALGCMLAHEDYAGVNYLAVHGAYGDQADANFIASPELFTVVFGAENTGWVNASPQDPNWNGAVAKITARVKPILLAGGKAWVAEAGQSDCTADWVRALIADGVPAATIKTNVVVVQHSDWNEDHTTDADLAYVKTMCAYQTINDGNGTSTARDPSAPATPSYRSTNTSFLPAALTAQNKKARAFWLESDWRIMDEGYLPDHSSITTGGVDFSDVVESHWIFGSPTDCDTIQKFWDKFVTNLPVPNNEPDFPTGRDYGDGGTVTPTSGAWIEKDGILAVEMEHGELHQDWTIRPSTYLTDPTMAGSMGDGWIEWAGAEKFSTTLEDSLANGVSIYRFQINKAGDYTFRWRSKQYNAGQAGDQGNDTYVKFETGSPITATGSLGGSYTLTKFTKVWVQSKAAWAWGTNFEPAHGDFVVNPKVHYEPGLHEIRIAGRSKGHAIDRFVLYHSTANGNTAQNAPESERVIEASYVYQATNDFPVINAGAVPYYKDNGNNALAINAANESYRDQWARAQLTFAGTAGVYDVTLTSLKELDGECSYRLLINGAQIGEVKNAATTVDYQEQDHVFIGVNIPAGATIAVASITHSNGKVQESGQPAGVWAWARGRWRTLTLNSNGTGTGISVSAGPDQVLLLPASGTLLTGSASDDGSISSVEWTQVSGPNTAVLTGAGQTNAAVSGLTGGTYVFRLTATDNDSNTAADEVEIVVTGQLTVYSDDFSSAAYASSLNGVNWNPKWASNTDQQNLHTGNGSMAVLDTSVAAENFHTPCKHGFSLSAEGHYAVIGSDFRYNHMAVSGVTAGLSKAAFGLMLSAGENWWTGPNKFFSIANHGIGIGPENALLDEVIEHSTLGVDRSVGGFSDWFRLEWTIERGAVNYMGVAQILDDAGAVLYTGPQVDLGFTNGATVFGGYSTGGDGGNGFTTNVASYSHFSEVNMDNFEIKVLAPNYAPYFKSDPIIGNSAENNVPYLGNLSDDAVDPNGDELMFFKSSGPAWLSVSPEGVLSGTPSAEDVGVNYFSVRVQDPDGLSDTAELHVDVADGPPPLPLTTLWAEDFEGAALGAASGNNATLAGTVVQTANTLSSRVVAAPAEFVSASDQVILLSSSSNQYSAIRPSLSSIDLSAYDIREGDRYMLSFDIYIPEDLAFPVGAVNFRWKDGANTVNGPTDDAKAVLTAGVHHLEYMGSFPVNTGSGDFIPSNVRPFIWFDQDGAALNDYVYFDNLDFKIGAAPFVVMPSYMHWVEEMKLSGGNENPSLDIDGDGLSNLEEFLSGFNPTNSASVFTVDAIQSMEEDSEQIIIHWEAKEDRVYSVSMSDDLTSGDSTLIADGLVYPQNSHTVDVSQAESGYLKVNVQLQ